MSWQQVYWCNFKILVNEGTIIKVRFRGKTYDYGYWPAGWQTIVLYEEGCRNMQDSIAVDPAECELVK